MNAYDPPQGFEPLRAMAHKWLSGNGIYPMPIITAGSQQALFLAGMALIEKGDKVVLEDPGYVGARRIFESLGASIMQIPYPVSPDTLDLLKDHDIKLLYIMPQGHIPTGKAIPDTLRGDILEIADSYDFYIIEDDPLSDVLGKRPLMAQDKNDRVIYIKSLSNILGPGIRIGFCVAPEKLYDPIVTFKEINDLSTSGMLQRMLYKMMLSNDFQKHISRLKTTIDNRMTYIHETFDCSTEGACLWVKTRMAGRIHMDNLMRLRVKITPGDIYGPKWSNYIRVSIITPNEEGFIKGMGIVNDYLRRDVKPDLITLF